MALFFTLLSQLQKWGTYGVGFEGEYGKHLIMEKLGMLSRLAQFSGDTAPTNLGFI